MLSIVKGDLGNRARIIYNLKENAVRKQLKMVDLVCLQDAPEFWISRQDYLEEGVACLSKCGQA